MGKLTFKTYEEAQESLSATKEELKVAKEEKKEYAKEHGLSSKEDHSEDPKHGKTWKKLKAMVEKKEGIIEETKAWMADNKPVKERAARAVKYDYPSEMTAAEKKKYRAEQRREKAKAEKGESGEKTEKKSKKKDKAEEATTTTKEEKSSKKDKGDKKADKKADKKKSKKTDNED